MNKTLKLIDCFCGAGGLSLGFKMAGFKSLFAFDNDQSCINTYNQNHGPHGFVMEAEKVSKFAIKSETGLDLSEVDVVAGGPPCQGFSVQRRGNDNDSRNNLVCDFIRIVEEIRPRFFLMENVGGLMSKRGKPFLEKIKDFSERANYYLHISKLLAYDYGVPQMRRRVFLVGELLDKGLTRFEFPNPVNNGNVKTVRDAISDLMIAKEHEVPNHRADKLSDINLKRIRSIREGQGRDSLPPDLQLPCHKNNKNHRHLDVYGRMAWDQPSATITARFDSFSRGRFGHPVLNRTITLREGARLQSFPDTFIFYGTKVQIAKQIGNAVPPLFAKAIAENIRLSLI